MADRFKHPSPWFAWHAIPVLKGEVESRRGQRVLEWGSGASTVWYAENGLSVTAIEHDPAWHAACRRYLATTADVRLVPLDSHYEAPDVRLGEFSIFVIDGRRRVQCAQRLIDAIEAGQISRGSLIVFDDTNRDRYDEAIEGLIKVCRRHRSYTGPTSVEIDKMTTLFWV